MAHGVKLGHGLNEDTKMGPLVSRNQQQTVLKYIDVGRNESATIATGGKAPGGQLADGFFVQPTIFTDVNNRMAIAQEEIFGSRRLRRFRLMMCRML